MTRLSPSQKTLLLILLGLGTLVGLLARPLAGHAGAPAQIPTGSIATVTGTPVNALAVVLDNDQGFANLRAGPNATYYEIVGVLVSGQSVPALGRSPAGEWIEVAYPGVPGGVAWVSKDLVDVRGEVPVVQPPPTPTPAVTATIDPTLAAQFLVEVPPTRLPTFTAPANMPTPTLPADLPPPTAGPVPMAFVIIGMAILGLIGTIISFLNRR